MPCDYKKYPSDWKTVIRPRILERAGNRCEQCGRPNGFEVEVWTDGAWELDTGDPSDSRTIFDNNGRQIIEGARAYFSRHSRTVKTVLTISHTDHDTTNNDDSNLKALCQRCHNIHDIPYRQKNAAATRARKKAQIQPALLTVGGIA